MIIHTTEGMFDVSPEMALGVAKRRAQIAAHVDRLGGMGAHVCAPDPLNPSRATIKGTLEAPRFPENGLAIRDDAGRSTYIESLDWIQPVAGRHMPSSHSDRLARIDHDDRVRRAAAMHLAFAGCPDISAAFERCDWSEVAATLRDAGHADRWEAARTAILDADPGADV